jgi:hypothetical protein
MYVSAFQFRNWSEVLSERINLTASRGARVRPTQKDPSNERPPPRFALCLDKARPEMRDRVTRSVGETRLLPIRGAALPRRS